ncbi:MAG: M3 family metallopeptidase [Gemmatimonadota bacterium]|nr:M3 family metallopeptidase [Gemmatimonadota bacterium]MDP6801737.1 M3 family metallopeptidase [Gemmatimonadota bacterium]MDP7031187.1 M3 family metallopeptidase [Gemmatimonadota bacterium]
MRLFAFRFLPALLIMASGAHASASPNRAPLMAYTTVDSLAIVSGCEAARQAADELLAAVAGVPDAVRTWDNTMRPLDRTGGILGEAFGRLAFLGYVAEDEVLRDTARGQEELLDKYEVACGFREDIYRAVEAYSRTEEAASLTGERRRFLKLELRDFRRNGFGLGKETRNAVEEMKNRLVEIGLEFDRNLAEWEDGIEVPPDRTGGLSESYLETLDQDSRGNYLVSLDYPELVPFMENSLDEDLRKELTRMNWNSTYPENLELLEEAIALRDRVATTLEYESWAHYRLEIRMAGNPDAVDEFLVDLAEKLRPKFDQDMALLYDRFGEEDANGTVDYWDWRHYHTRLLRTDYRVDPEEVAQYFPLGRVLDGLFSITQEMFSLVYREVEDPDAWHADVQLFEVSEAATGDLIGYFYTDLFPRSGKFSHAAAFTLRSGGHDEAGRRIIPVSAIVANVTKPTDDAPSLLTHDEVETMFHEFGHILHQILTRAETIRFAGSSTERDFVEAPSQNLEHWIWEPDVLARFAGHHETGEPIPRGMVESMVAAKNLNEGIRALRQVFYASLDMAYHAPGETKNTTDILEELHPICGFPPLPGTHLQAGFGHLFGYDAGYYGYLWSKVYGDDMYTAFRDAGILNPEVGMRYRKEILEKGGTLDGGDLIRNFLGREPNNRAFLEELGLEVD